MTDAATVPIYLFVGLAGAAGWPQKRGFLGRRLVIASGAAHTIHTEVVHRGVGLAIADPALAVQVLADTFAERAWDGPGVLALLEMLSAAYGSLSDGVPQNVDDLVRDRPDLTPWEAIVVRGLDERAMISSHEIAWNSLNDREFQVLLNGNFSAGLLWALRHPDIVSEALQQHCLFLRYEIAAARKAGLLLPVDYQPQTVERFLTECAGLALPFSRRVRPLLPVPRPVLEHPELGKYIARQRTII